MCQSLLLYTAKKMLTDCRKSRCTINIRWTCNASSFAPASPAHVRITEHDSVASHLAAQLLLSRRVREWGMRWHLHLSVCSLMTQRGLLSLSLSLPASLHTSMLFSSVILQTPHLPISGAAHLKSKPAAPLANSPARQFPQRTCQKKDTFNFILAKIDARAWKEVLFSTSSSKARRIFASHCGGLGDCIFFFSYITCFLQHFWGLNKD